MNDPEEPPSEPDPRDAELLLRYEEYLHRLREINLEEVLKNFPVQDGEPLSEQLERALQAHIYEIRRKILWKQLSQEEQRPPE